MGVELTQSDIVGQVAQSVTQDGVPNPAPIQQLGSGNQMLDTINNMLTMANNIINNIVQMRQGVNTMTKDPNSTDINTGGVPPINVTPQPVQQPKPIPIPAPKGTKENPTVTHVDALDVQINYDNAFNMFEEWAEGNIEKFKDKTLGEMYTQFKTFKPIIKTQLKAKLEPLKPSLFILVQK